MSHIPVGHKAFFNALHLQWLHDPSIPAERWQIENYRELTLGSLFSALAAKGFSLDRSSFIALTQEWDSPEELVESMLIEAHLPEAAQDQVYLLVFELWRRLVPEKQSLSIFGDELDHLISQNETGNFTQIEALEDAIANLVSILDDNCDQGGEPQEIFDSVQQACAHDLEAFFYDFIADQIENKNESFAAELLESLFPYVKDKQWFSLLNARVALLTDPPEGKKLIQKLVKENAKKPDLEFTLEILSAVAQGGESALFQPLLTQALSLISTEEEFQDLLAICADYLHYLDYDHKEAIIQNILSQRSHIEPQQPFDKQSPHLQELLQLLR